MIARQAASRFLPEERIASLAPLGNGNINETYLLTLTGGEQRVLQRLRPEIFADPVQVMFNLQHLLAHFARIEAAPYEFVQIYPVLDGVNWWLDTDGGCWRLLSFVGPSHTLQRIEHPKQACAVGQAVGWLHRVLADLDLPDMQSPIPHLHDTGGYLRCYDQFSAENEGASDREQFCRTFVARERERCRAMIQAAAPDGLPRQLVHGDPKVANFLFANDGASVLGLIDFDTAGSGLRLHDIGDGLRSCCNPGGEDMDPAESVSLRGDFYQAWLQGYLGEAEHLLLPEERALIPEALWTITFELGLRFFIDHLQGNRYFTVSYPQHNLHRACVQFHLCRDIAARMRQLHL